MNGDQYLAWPHRLMLVASAEEDCLPRSPPPADDRPPWPWEGQRSAFLLAMAPVELPHGPESQLKRQPLSKSAWTRLLQGKVFLYQEKYALQPPRNETAIILFFPVGACIHIYIYTVLLKYILGLRLYSFHKITAMNIPVTQYLHITEATLCAALDQGSLAQGVKLLGQGCTSRCWIQTHKAYL